MVVVNHRNGRQLMNCLAARSATRRVDVGCQGIHPLVLILKKTICLAPSPARETLEIKGPSIAGEGWGATEAAERLARIKAEGGSSPTKKAGFSPTAGSGGREGQRQNAVGATNTCRHHHRFIRIVAVLALVAMTRTVSAAAPSTPPTPNVQSVAILPATFTFAGVHRQSRLLVTGETADGSTADLTDIARYESTNPAVATVDARGLVTSHGKGQAEIVAHHGARTARTTIIVQSNDPQPPVDFRIDANASLGRAGCSQGACHGSPQGKNGFRLSLRGFDSDLDLLTIVREAGGRRIDLINPADSLLLKKGSGRVPHQGGVRFKPDEAAYKTLERWIAEGARDSVRWRKLVKLEVLPGPRRLNAQSPRQRLTALAHFEDRTVATEAFSVGATAVAVLGRPRFTVEDVTDLSVYTANPDSAFDVSPDGVVTFHATGEAVVLVRYLEQVRSIRLTYVRTDPEYAFRGPVPANLVDRQVLQRQKLLQLQPTAVAADSVFLRRVYLDVIGTLPTAEESQAFLSSTAPDKRASLIDQLLDRDEYAQFWALKWADVMRGSRETISERGVHSFHRYLVRAFAADRPFSETAREIVTGAGNTLYHPEANFFRIAETPEDAAESTAQLFLGVRVQCARCHNHPFEAITQGDYYGLAAYFARVKNKGRQFMLDDAVVYLARSGEVQHPLTKKPLEPVAFGAKAPPLTADDDRRTHLAQWLTAAGNPYFAKSTVNRVWYHLLGTGLVEPVDDFRDSNPASHPELLDGLAQEFVRSGYRFKPVLRAILNSQTYQLGSQSDAQSKEAARPDRYFTHAKIRMLSAEQILDGICSATGLPETFPGYPAGTRAIDLAEGAIDHHFLAAFSKPIRDVQCDCAREDEPSLNQVIHLLNNASIIEKIRSPESRLGKLLSADRPTPEIVEAMYLATISRRPTEAEQQVAAEHVKTVGDRRTALEDLQHALLNSNEFLLRH